MRKLIFVISITLDGCCDHTKVIGDDEVHEYFTQLFWNAHVLVWTENVPLQAWISPSQLMQLDLIDEFHFVVQPLLVGEGRRLLEETLPNYTIIPGSSQLI